MALIKDELWNIVNETKIIPDPLGRNITHEVFIEERQCLGDNGTISGIATFIFDWEARSCRDEEKNGRSISKENVDE